jgi:hypothetical protein
VRYVTGIHALNLPCALPTCGDWHTAALRWKDVTFGDTDTALFGTYGIEYDKHIPEHEETFAVANHIRALLDLLEQGNFSAAQGMNRDFICNADYDREVFEKVAALRSVPHWPKIDAFMAREYYNKWVRFKRRAGV